MMEDRPPGLSTIAIHGGGREATVASLEQRIALLEGGTAAVAVAAGPAAALGALRPLLRPGDQLIMARELAAPWHLAADAADSFGWAVRRASLDDIASFEQAITPKTQAIIAPSVGEGGEVADIAALARLSKRAQVPLIVDNSTATPVLCRPVGFGADVVLHIDTRSLAGRPTGAGFIVDAGRFNWLAGDRYPALAKPRGGQDRALAQSIGNFAYAESCREFSAAGLDASRLASDLETLPLRMAQHAATAKAVAGYLAEHRRVVAVNHAALSGDRHHVLAQTYCPGGPGARIVFATEGGEDTNAALFERLRLIARGGESSSMSRVSLSTPDGGTTAVRLDVGLEDAIDIIADLDQALAQL